MAQNLSQEVLDLVQRIKNGSPLSTIADQQRLQQLGYQYNPNNVVDPISGTMQDNGVGTDYISQYTQGWGNNYDMWRPDGSFMHTAVQPSGNASIITPLIAAAAMYFGLPPTALGSEGVAAAGMGATEGAGMTAAEAWGSGAGLGGDTLGAMGVGEGAAATGAGSSGLYSLAGSAGAPAAPGMTTGTTGLGMSSGGVSTSGLTSGTSGLASMGATGAAGGTGSLLSGLGAAGQAASGASGLSSLFSDPKDLQSMVALGSGIGGFIDSQNKQDAINNNTNSFMNRWDSFYAPGSNEYNLLKQEMERKDAAAGRNSQYGTRLAEMGGRIAQAKFNSLSSMYGVANNGVQAANAVGSGLGQLAGGIGTAAQNGTLSKIFGGQ